jgi:hypothetical protein
MYTIIYYKRHVRFLNYHAPIYLAVHFINAYALLNSIGYILRVEYNKKGYI